MSLENGYSKTLTVNTLGAAGHYIISSMFVSHAFVCLWLIALVWLVNRARIIVHRPKAELIDKLGLTEPVVPEVTIDGLGANWVSINWHYPSPSTRTRRPKLREHIIQIDGQSLRADKDQRRFTILDLQPDTTYKLTLQAVQISHSDSSIISPATTSTGISTSASSIAVSSASSHVPSSSPVAMGVSKSIYLHTLLAKNDAPPPLETMLRYDTPEFSAAEQAKVQDIVNIQNEVREVLHQFSCADTQFLAKHKALMLEYTEINSQRKTDEAQRTQLRVENKNLEDENHALEVQISKTKLQAAKFDKSLNELNKTRAEINRILEIQETRKTESDALLDALETRVNTLQDREIRLNTELKDALYQARSTENQCEQARAILRNIRNISQNATLKEKLNILHSEDSSALGEKAIREIEHECDLDDRIEHEWARAQKMLENRYVDAYLANSEQKAQWQIQQQQQQQQSQQQQSQQQSQQQHPKHSQQSQQQQLPFQHPQNRQRASTDAVHPFALSTQHRRMNSQLSSHSNDDVSSPDSLASNTPPPSIQPGSNFLGLNPGLLQSGSRHHPHTGNPLIGSGTPVISPIQLQSSTSLRSPPSLASMHSVNSMNAPHLPSPSLHSVHSVHSVPVGSYDPFVAHTPSVPSLVTVPQASLDAQRANHHAEDAVISPTAANDLLPSNLFQDSLLDTEDSNFSSAVSVNSDKSGKANDNKEQSNSPRSRGKDASWIPWLSANKPSHSRRTTSLFFGSNADESPIIDDPPSQKEDSSDRDDEQQHHQPQQQPQESSSSGKSPLKGMSSRIFQKSNNRSGSFVRRLSLFSRKDTEPKLEEEPEE